MDKTVRIVSAIVLASVVLGAIINERKNFFNYIGKVGLISAVFCLISIAIGFYVPRAVGVSTGQAIASAMEIGVHNSTLAITIALSVIDGADMAIPAAVYSIVMFPVAAIVDRLISRWHIAQVAGGSHKKGGGNRKAYSGIPETIP